MREELQRASAPQTQSGSGARVQSLSLRILKGEDIGSYIGDRYEKEFLFSDAEADETICSYKQTTFIYKRINSSFNIKFNPYGFFRRDFFSIYKQSIGGILNLSLL